LSIHALVKESHKFRFPHEYAAFKSGQEVIVTGTQLSLWADSYPPEVVKRGILDLCTPLSERAKGLMLRDAMAAPGVGVKCMLYNPQLTHVGNKELLFRGFELIKESGAAVMQEWRVFLV
jgi:hypothetical protein